MRPAAWPSCITLNVQGFLCLLHHEKCGADMSRALCPLSCPQPFLPQATAIISSFVGPQVSDYSAPESFFILPLFLLHATVPGQKSSTLATKFPLKLVSYPHIVVGFEPSDRQPGRMGQTRCAPQGPWVDGTREGERKKIYRRNTLI